MFAIVFGSPPINLLSCATKMFNREVRFPIRPKRRPVKEFSCIKSSWSCPLLERAEEKSRFPSKLFSDKLTWFREAFFPSVVGTWPDSWLLSKDRMDNFDKLPMEGGICLVNWLDPRSRCESSCIRPNSNGISPLRLPKASSSETRVVRLLRTLGIEPIRLLELKPRYWSCGNLATQDGTTSIKEFSNKPIVRRCWHDASPDVNRPAKLFSASEINCNIGRLKLRLVGNIPVRLPLLRSAMTCNLDMLYRACGTTPESWLSCRLKTSSMDRME